MLQSQQNQVLISRSQFMGRFSENELVGLPTAVPFYFRFNSVV